MLRSQWNRRPLSWPPIQPIPPRRPLPRPRLQQNSSMKISHFETWWKFGGASELAKLLECGSPLALWPRAGKPAGVCRPLADVRMESGRGLPHSKTWRTFGQFMEIESAFRRIHTWMLIACTLFLGFALSATAAEKKVSYYKEVVPLFKRSCTGCHHPGKLKGELDLTTYQAFKKGGKHGGAFKAGDLKESIII